jgi:magnesium-transporting ATPase (P-type)
MAYRVFFDKTGTLTKQGLDFLYATDLLDRPMDYSYDRKPTGYLKIAMATCHSLTVTSSNVIVGNQVDINMFQAVRGVFVEPNQDYQLRIQVDNGTTYTILKRFDFDHHRMVMSVIIQDEAGNIHAFVKGSGDSIKRYCDISTIPSQYDKYMNDGARKGTYQIALSMKTLSNDQAFDVSNLSRDDIEKDLTFIGVINFKNLLREETSDVIRELKEGGIVSAIITGDSVLTGICIARECGIIHSGAVVLLGKAFNENDCSIEWVNDNDEIIPDPTAMTLSDNTVLAVTGNVWDGLWKQSKTNAMSLAKFIRVYGRCTPINKADIVTAFVDQGHVCCMCGDGGNDCGALKTAHVGIALSDADASTVSPFTSLDKSITAVVDVIKEGRCALASAFAAYKYMILYGQIETLTQLINAYFSISLSEWW